MPSAPSFTTGANPSFCVVDSKPAPASAPRPGDAFNLLPAGPAFTASSVDLSLGLAYGATSLLPSVTVSVPLALLLNASVYVRI